ncbi:MAG: hypothetical protein ACJA2D_000506 [Pseudohongiellaceae bacterium]|jgi:hypothetical protein
MEILMRKKIKTNGLREIASYIGLSLCLLPGVSYSDSVWDFVSVSQYEDVLDSIATPGNAFAAVPIDISFSYLATLESSDEIEIRVSEATTIKFFISDILSYPNGDIGWHSANNTGAGLQTLSMTAGSNYFLASITTQENSYKVIAKKQLDGDSYIGWLYEELRQFGNEINDTVLQQGQDRSTRRQISPAPGDPVLSVTISAELVDEYYFFMEKDLVWKFTLNNPLATATNPLTLTILGKYVDETSFPFYNFVENSELFDLPQNCQKVTYADSDIYRKIGEIRCDIDALAPNSSVIITLKSRVKSSLVLDDLQFGALSFPSASLSESETSRTVYSSYDGYSPGPIPVLDVLTDTDADGVSDFNEGLLGTDSADKNSGAHRDVIIDVAVLYTSNFREDISVDPETRINSAFTTVNEVFKGSNTGIQFNIIHYELLDYTNNCSADRCSPGQRWNDTQTVLNEYGKRNEKQWRFSEKIRALKGADYVMIMDGKGDADPTAGQAASGTTNRGYFGLNKHNRTLFAHYDEASIDFSEETMSHELGHMFGISHSRKQSNETFGSTANTSGTFPWATGHAVQGEYATIMPYASKFGIYWNIKRFSDPSRMDCDYIHPVTFLPIVGANCGVDRTDIDNGADAVSAMKIVRYQHEKFSPSRPSLPTKSTDGLTYSSKFLAGAIKDIELGFRTDFLPSDKINAEGTINISTEHVGKMGATHIIVDAGALGTFQIDSSGSFVALNLATLNLVGSISQRPLKAVENLTVFSDLAFADLGVTAINLNIFFAYTLSDSNVLVYTGTPLVIKVGS